MDYDGSNNLFLDNKEIQKKQIGFFKNFEYN
jgi:hypothetical protein